MTDSETDTPTSAPPSPDAGTPPSRPLLRIDSVSRRFGEIVALDRVTIDIAENEFFSLLGPSGCGKTTLLRIIAGLEHPDEGTVTLAGEDLVAMPAHRRPVNLMFQSYALFPHLDVAKNVAYGLHRERRPKAEIVERVDEALETVGLAGLGRRRVNELSGGQRQRVALARAMVKRPQILLLDEPLGALDKQIRSQMQQELKRLQHEVGITFVVVTHDQEEAMSMADRIAVLRDGRVEQMASPGELFDRPASRFVAEFIGTTNLFGVGDRLTSVRPERMRILPSDGDDMGPNRLSGRIADVQFYGGVSHCIVEVVDGPAGAPATVVVALIGSTDLAPDQQVTVAWSPEHAVELPR